MSETCESIYDVAVIGAGLQGASVALEAVNRGLRTLVIHSGIVGGTSSSRQSILDTGGYEHLSGFNINALICNSGELNIIRQRMPHLVTSLPAYFVQNDTLFTRLKINVLAKLYDKANRQANHLKHIEDPFQGAFSKQPMHRQALPTFALNYARMGIAILQRLLGDKRCELLLQHRLSAVKRNESDWHLSISDIKHNQSLNKKARLVINCTGAHVDDVIRDTFELKTRGSATPTVSAHIFLSLPQSWQAAAIFSGKEKQQLTLHPLNESCVCLGPIYATDNSELAKTKAIDSALVSINRNLTKAFSQENVMHCDWAEQAFVEDPLNGRPSEDLLFDLNNPGDVAPLLSLFGNKPCQHRKIAQQTMDVLKDFYRHSPIKSDRENILPGGNFAEETPASYLKNLALRYTFIEQTTLKRLVSQFGTRCDDILRGVNSLSDMGRHFGHGLFEREVQYLRESEWANSAEDILWRRTLLGTVFDDDQETQLRRFLGS